MAITQAHTTVLNHPNGARWEVRRARKGVRLTHSKAGGPPKITPRLFPSVEAAKAFVERQTQQKQKQGYLPEPRSKAASAASTIVELYEAAQGRQLAELVAFWADHQEDLFQWLFKTGGNLQPVFDDFPQARDALACGLYLGLGADEQEGIQLAFRTGSPTLVPILRAYLASVKQSNPSFQHHNPESDDLRHLLEVWDSEAASTLPGLPVLGQLRALKTQLSGITAIPLEESMQLELQCHLANLERSL